MTHSLSLSEAVARLLRLAPDSWADVPETFSADEQAALESITAAGFVERRITFTVQLPGKEQAQRIIIEATGEFGLLDAMQSVIQDWWACWGQQWQELRQEIGEPVKPIVVLQRNEWRLSEQGRLARIDLANGEQRPIDFALKRGFFDGKPRRLPDGRVVKREPVRGYGRLVSIENVCGQPLTVAVENWQKGAEAFAKALEPFLRPQATLQPATAQAEFVLARDGDGWFIRAFGEQGHFKALRGFEHLAKLLERPGEPVLMAYLVGGLTGTMTAADAKQHGLHVGYTRQSKADESLLAALKRKIDECNQGIVDAECVGDTTEAEVLKNEREMYLKQLDDLMRPGGACQTFGSDADKLRATVRMALGRAYATLRKGGMPKTANHLEVAISAQGDSYLYRPESPIAWKIKF
ncbi:hypothetical protein [Thermogutta sp.]|uniref:hypothetical protein n=1 Tax=Thermogutta sp. TaxID=1962930 RepID=UPI0032207E49